MNKSRAEDVKRFRQRRKDSGLVEFRCYCTPEQKEKLKRIVAEWTAQKNTN